MATTDRTEPLITVLMPVKAYEERYLLEAVGSVLAQGSPAWRLLVIRTGRRELRRVLAHHLEDPRAELIVNRGRQLAGALNTGMRAARTEFVAILLGDDLWAPDAVEVLTRAIAGDPEADFLHSARRWIDDDGRPVSSVHAPRDEVALEDFVRSSPVKHLLCWRRSMGLAIGGMDESLNSVGPDDFDFPWSMAEHGARFKAVPECLYIGRDHRASYRLTTHLPLSVHRREITRIMTKHGVPADTIAARLEAAEEGYLRQCLYRSRFDRWLSVVRGRGRQEAWREPYR